jgi:hypothetical protein
MNVKSSRAPGSPQREAILMAATATFLREIGFFELRGSKDYETFWVPFLFRDALSMSQGLAD